MRASSGVAVEEVSQASLPVKRMAATVLFTDAVNRVLVVQPTYKPRWELPGGAVEPGESPWTAARREVAEELGLDCRPGQLLALDYVPAADQRTEGMITVFDGGVLGPQTVLRLPPDELRGYAFVESEQLTAYLPALLSRRAAAALTARSAGATVYLENGHRLDGAVLSR